MTDINGFAKKSSKVGYWVFGIFVFITMILVFFGYLYSWAPIGVVEYSYKPNGSIEGVKNIKTFWDWLDLLVVPVLIGISLWWINQLDERAKLFQEQLEKNNQKIQEERIRKEQIAREDYELRVSIDNQKQKILDSYISKVTNIVLDRNLLSSSNNEPVNTILRALTKTVLHELDGNRKGQVIRFLFEAGLIKISKPVISLSGADLRKINLRKANLSQINLTRSNLSGSSLNRIKLNRSCLVRCNLINSDLSNADLRYAILDRSNITNAILVGANFSNTSLIKACLRNANLQNTIFDQAKVNGADFTQSDLRGADLSNTKLDGAKLKKITFDHTTKWPNDFDVKIVSL